jgi:magnesium chelatase subunit D
MTDPNHENGGHKDNRKSFPFAAIVGQEDLKLCLILCAIDPSIGGVLIRGDKGTAKSTAARGLANVLPPIQVACDPSNGALDPYNRDSASIEEGISNHTNRNIPTPFVDLPIGATEDRVLGSIDFSATLKQAGKPVFSPGVLASANRGILYIDEVNLLPAHLVDVLLDASAMGVNTIQREGLTLQHPSKFLLVGTMNPEEGDLRPQLIDRFGLMCDVVAPRDVKVRSEVVRQRIAFDACPETFRDTWEDAEQDLSTRIVASRDRLHQIVFPDEFLELTSRICVEFQVASLRADITLYKTAKALAAWYGRMEVEREDLKQAAKWVLAHRKQRNPFDAPPPPPPSNNNSPEDDLMDQILNSPPPQGDDGSGDDDDDHEEGPDDPENDPREDSQEGEENNADNNGDSGMQTFTASKPEQIKRLQLGKQQIKGQAGTGRRNALPRNSSRTGHYVRSMPTDKPVDLALDATLRSAAVNGLDQATGIPIIRSENWRRKVKQATTDTLIMFVVDASGSMSARQRMESVKGAVLALLTDAYQQRDRVGVIAFRGLQAEVLLSPTSSVELAERQLLRLPTGGRTPLAHALKLSHETLQKILAQDPDQSILLILLSDGKANVPLPNGSSSGTAWEQTEQMADKLANLSVPTLFLDTDVGHVRVGKGKELAQVLQADYLQLEDLSADGLVHTIRQAKA